MAVSGLVKDLAWKESVVYWWTALPHAAVHKSGHIQIFIYAIIN